MASPKAPSRTKKTTPPAKPLPSTRIMLLLSPDLIRTVDHIASIESKRGLTINRQDAIRIALAKLGDALAQAPQ